MVDKIVADEIDLRPGSVPVPLPVVRTLEERVNLLELGSRKRYQRERMVRKRAEEKASG